MVELCGEFIADNLPFFGVIDGNLACMRLRTTAYLRLSSFSRVFSSSFWNVSLAARDFMICFTLFFVSSMILFALSSSASSNWMRLCSLTQSSSIFWRLYLI